MKLTPLTSLAAVLVIGAGGFMAGWISSSGFSTSTTENAEAPTRPTRSSLAAERSESTTTKRSSRRDAATRDASNTREQRLGQLEMIVRGEDPLDRNRALLAYIDQLGSGDFQEAIDNFRQLGITESRMAEYAMLLSAWAKTDPYAALEYAKANTGTPFATQTILSTWVATDPEGAIRWAETNHQNEGANPYMASIISSLAATDPLRATSLLTRMPHSGERENALDAMLPHLLRQGADATRTWIEGLKDDSLKDGALIRAAHQLAATDPAGTVALLLANPSQATQHSMAAVYSIWSLQDQQTAVKSLASIPNSRDRSNALCGIITSIASEKPADAVALMNRYPADVNDLVLQVFVWHTISTDPATAINQVGRIGDEGCRDRMYRNAVTRWIQLDAAAAGTWLESSSLSDELRQDLTRLIPLPQ